MCVCKTWILVFMTALLFAQRVPADTEDALRFKTEYEALNGSVTQAGEQYLSVEIPAENQVIYLTAEEAASLLETGTGVVLMGAPWCPWCRHAVTAWLDAAWETGLERLYYVDMTSERDGYALQAGMPVQTQPGTEGYFYLMEVLEAWLPEYTLSVPEGITYHLGETRIGIPFAAAFVNGTLLDARDMDAELEEGQSVFEELTDEQHQALVEQAAQMMRVVQVALQGQEGET